MELRPPTRSRTRSCSTRRIFGLGDQAEVADLVQKERSAIGLLKLAHARLHAGGDAFFDAEELAFEQGFGQRGAVERHERAARPRAGVVDGLGHQFLAGAAFAGDQHVHQAVADTLHQADHLLNPGSGADNSVGGVFAFHLAQQVGVLLRQFVFAAAQFADELGVFDGDGGVRGQGIEEILVALAEGADPLVERFEGADDLAFLVADGHGQHVARAVAGLVVNGVIELRMAVSVLDVDGLAGGGGPAGDPHAGIEAQDFVAAQRHLGPQFVDVRGPAGKCWRDRREGRWWLRGQ